MINASFVPVIKLVEAVANQIYSWRNNVDLRCIHCPSDFKTEADLRAHQLLKEGLNDLFASVPVISEEDLCYNYSRPEKYWLIDPIDGTASWYNGFSGYVSQAAFFVRGVPVFGVIVAPALQTLWYGEKKCGAFKNHERLALLKKRPDIIIIDNTPLPHGISLEMYHNLPATNYIESGSIGLKSVFVADGTADLFVKDVVVRDWDLAPAFVLLDEVCGVLIQSDGSDYCFRGNFKKENGFIVSRNVHLASRVIRLLNSKI